MKLATALLSVARDHGFSSWRALKAEVEQRQTQNVAVLAYPLHFAAGSGHLETVRALLEAGADVHGTGDVHKGEVIGWAAREGNEAVVKLLLERGARHHIS